MTNGAERKAWLFPLIEIWFHGPSTFLLSSSTGSVVKENPRVMASGLYILNSTCNSGKESLLIFQHLLFSLMFTWFTLAYFHVFNSWILWIIAFYHEDLILTCHWRLFLQPSFKNTKVSCGQLKPCKTSCLVPTSQGHSSSDSGPHLCLLKCSYYTLVC